MPAGPPEPTSPAVQRRDALLWEPGGTVLRNKLGLRDPEDLRAAEYRLSAARQVELERGDVVIPRTFLRDHLQALHRHLFHDVYDWAGEFRDVNLSKGRHTFAFEHEVPSWLDQVERLVDEQDWSSMSREQFVRSVADVYVHLNIAHPFREGNGRTAKEFLSDVADLSPYRLDWDKVNKATWDRASDAATPEFSWQEMPERRELAAVFDSITVDRDPAKADPQTSRAVGLLNSTYPTVAGTAPAGTSPGERPVGTSIAARVDQGPGRGE